MKKAAIALITLIILFTSACQPVAPKPDLSLIASSTAVMKTMEALGTQLARVSNPTSTPDAENIIPSPIHAETTGTADSFNPIATSTLFPTPALPMNTCDAAEYLSETIADKTLISPGTKFVKSWTLRNAGTCTWTKDYRLVFVSGDAMTNATSIAFVNDEVKPGESVTLSVNMVAPDAEGEYFGFWKMTNSQGLPFGLGGEGKAIYVQIIVGPEIKEPFKVIAASVSTIPTNFKGICGKNGFMITFIGKIRTNRAGTVTYHWEANGGRVDSALQKIVFFGADEATVTNNFVYRRGYHEDWVRLFIDSPNNQGFSRVEYNVECTD